jgi:CubicO group peptidase (beta-lactamase class C family)
VAGFLDRPIDRRALFASTGALAAVSAAPMAALAAAGEDRLCGSAHASWIPSDECLRELPRLMRVAALPGLSIAVVEDGRLAWSGSFGVKNIMTGDPVTDETLFEAASMTKPVFAYLVMRLVDENLLELERPLVDYRRPEYLSGDADLKRITVRDVLRHSSGLPNWASEPLATTSTPGLRYTYSGEAMVWLQLIVEKLVGAGLGAVMRDRLFAPAGMSSSTFGWDEGVAAAAVHGHSGPGDDERKLPAQPTRQLGNQLLPIAKKWRKPIASWTYEDSVAAMREADPGTAPSTHNLLVNAAGGLLTTARDYARFMALMMEGRRRAAWEISESSRRSMLTIHLEVRGRDVARGLGWELEQGRGARLFQHSGSNYGIFRTLGVGDAEARRAIVILTNGANGNVLAQRIVREATGMELLKSLV